MSEVIKRMEPSPWSQLADTRDWLEAAEGVADWWLGACHEQEERAKAAEAEVVRLREALQAIFDSVVLDRGGIERTDAITSARAALAVPEEPNP